MESQSATLPTEMFNYFNLERLTLYFYDFILYLLNKAAQLSWLVFIFLILMAKFIYI